MIFLNFIYELEWNLNDTEIASISSIVFAGVLFGALFWGTIADIYGRRRAYLAAAIFISLGGFASGISPNLTFLLVCRFLVGFGVGGLAVPFDLLAEFLPLSHRGKFLLYIELFWTFGSLLVAGIAWASLSQYGWRFLTYMTAIPVTLACIASMIYLPESPRWYLENGYVKEAKDMILLANKRNKKELQPFTLISTNPTKIKPNYKVKTVNNFYSDKTYTNDQQNHWYSNILSLISPLYIRTSIPLWIVWLSFGFTYYGIILFVSRIFSTNSTSNVDTCTFDFEPIFLNAISEIIGSYV